MKKKRQPGVAAEMALPDLPEGVALETYYLSGPPLGQAPSAAPAVVLADREGVLVLARVRAEADRSNPDLIARLRDRVQKALVAFGATPADRKAV